MEKLIRLEEVKAQIGFGRSFIYASIKEGGFPAPVKVGKHAVAWRQSEIESWIAERPRTDLAR